MTEADSTLATYLGRPPTPAEREVYAAQRARLETGIFDNPLLPRAEVGDRLVTLVLTGLPL